MELNNLLTTQQIDCIKHTIVSRCAEYNKMEELRSSLYYVPYTRCRKQYDLTSAVISAFSPTQCCVPGFSVEDLSYGMKAMMCQPELRSDVVVMHVYGNGASLKTKTIRERARRFNGIDGSFPVFCAVVFKIDKKHGFKLKSLELVVFDAEGEVRYRFEL